MSVCVCVCVIPARMQVWLRVRASVSILLSLAVHGAELSSVFSVLSHPSPTDPLSVSPSVIPSSRTLTHCSLISLCTIRTISHATHAAVNTSSLFFFFLYFPPFSTPLRFPLIFLFHPFVSSILGTLCAFTHSFPFIFTPPTWPWLTLSS